MPRGANPGGRTLLTGRRPRGSARGAAAPVLAGPVDEALTEGSLRAAYGTRVRVVSAVDDGAPTRTCAPSLRVL